MPLKHGNKRYMQVLLDNARYELLERYATSVNMRVTALAREIVYQWLETNCKEYEDAATADRAQWVASVKNRIEGKIAKKLEGHL
jgi:hypothetical protein